MMHLTTLEIPEDEVRAKLAEYEALLAEDRTAEDEAIAAGYRAAARGLPVITLSRTVAAGGFHDNGLPRIAVVNAAAQTCFATWSGDSLVFAVTDDWRANRGALVGPSSVRVPIAEPPATRSSSYWRMASAPVPLVPPQHRPRRPRRLSRCHVLWEVDEWAPVVARDPALLRHIRGDLWAVLATWDLTELERAVLSQRL
jgi:hypothetical protein